MTKQNSPVSQAAISTLLKATISHQRTGEFDKAIACCLEVCAQIPEQADALHLLAIIHAQSGRYLAANDYFARAIASAPLRADFLGNYANALWEQDRMDEALDHCQRSLALNGSQAHVHNILGNIYLTQHRHEAAAESFRMALSLQPDYPHALNNLGNALQKMNRLDEAIASYEQALSLQSNYAEAWNNLGQALKRRDRIGEARVCFRKAVNLRADFASAAENLTQVDPIWLAPLKGKKLRLRRYQEKDALYLRQCFQNPQFMAQYNHFIPRHQHADDLAKQLRETHDKHPCQTKSVSWVILKNDTHQYAGIANLVAIEFAHRRAEFLIGLPDPADHAKGIGLEATLLIMDYAFNKVSLNKLTTAVYEENAPSQHNTLALGFVQECYLQEHLAEPVTGRLLNVYGNGMTVSDFRCNKRLSKLSKRLLGRDITA